MRWGTYWSINYHRAIGWSADRAHWSSSMIHSETSECNDRGAAQMYTCIMHFVSSQQNYSSLRGCNPVVNNATYIDVIGPRWRSLTKKKEKKKKIENVTSRSRHFARTFAIIKSTLLPGNLDSPAGLFPSNRSIARQGPSFTPSLAGRVKKKRRIRE